MANHDRRRPSRRTVPLVCALALLGVLLAAPASAAPPAAGPAPGAQCRTEVVGVDERGTAILGPIVCGGDQQRALAMLATSAVHYTGPNGGGGSLVITNACGGAQINLPAAWDNVISSTWSACTVVHYDTDGFGGASQATPPGGPFNLGSLDNRAESAIYW
jgi:hypothetical protein